VRFDDRHDGAASGRRRARHANPGKARMAEIAFKSVSKAYSGKTVLHDFSLIVEPGQRVVIVGPSGCGKTTILRLLAGFIAPDTA
jgi:ABC-type Fe3+/spermidine/putrescine transport system ATPase subunit